MLLIKIESRLYSDVNYVYIALFTALHALAGTSKLDLHILILAAFLLECDWPDVLNRYLYLMMWHVCTIDLK